MRGGFTCVQHSGDVRVLHEGQGLALRFKPSDHLPGVHARLDDFEGHLAPDRRLLFGHVDNAKPALADLFQNSVAAYSRTEELTAFLSVRSQDRGLEKTPGLFLGSEDCVHLHPELGIARTSLIQESGARLRRRDG